MNMGHSQSHTRLLVGKPMLLMHALQRTVNYGVVIVSRNLEWANENDGFKITAFEFYIIHALLTDLK